MPLRASRPRRVASAFLAVILLAGGLVWAAAVADVVLDDAAVAEAANLLIEPSVDSIYESGSVAYTVTVVTPDLIDAPEDQRKIRISIDDSISIPEFDPVAYSQAVFFGAVEGTAYAGAAIVSGIPDA